MASWRPRATVRVSGDVFWSPRRRRVVVGVAVATLAGGGFVMATQKRRPRREDWRAPCVRLREACAARGLDCCAFTTARAYNDAAPSTAKITAEEDVVVAVVGNSKALWPTFERAVRANRAVSLDEYVEGAVREAVARAVGAEANAARIYWSWELEPGRVVAIQRLAHVANLAYLDERTHQSVHPTHGPWCAFRAAVVLDGVRAPKGGAEDETVFLPRLASPVSEERVARAAEAFDVAIARYEETNGNDPEQWKLWLACRDAMDGGEFAHRRYSEDQILWHYDADSAGARRRMLEKK
jgi:hypothetical protein